MTTESRPPFQPFIRETAAQKVRKAEDAWNTRDPVAVSLAYTPDTVWRNRAFLPATRIMRCCCGAPKAKLLRIAFAVWTSGQPFDPTKIGIQGCRKP